MYIDLNVDGLLFQAFAAIFAAASGILLVFRGRYPLGIARIRPLFRNSKRERNSTEGKQAEE